MTSRSMINIPAAIRKKYGIKEGDRVAFMENDAGLTLVRIPLKELYGADRAHRSEVLRAIREIEAEHRSEGAA